MSRNARASDVLVSICIPTYRGSRWINDTLESALSQDYEPLEVLVLDNASDDGTWEIVQGCATRDQRIRAIRQDRNVGAVANFNHAIAQSRGSYVKLLMQDDLLETECVRAMASVMNDHPSVGMVFSPRHVLLEDPRDTIAQRWAMALSVLHTDIEPLSEVNEGRQLVARYLRGRLDANPFGEPTAVMVRRNAFEEAGLFGTHLTQLTDLEVWLRIAARFDVGFVREPLATFRFHQDSATSANTKQRTAWLDRVWLAEGLLADPAAKPLLGRFILLKAWHASLVEEGKWAVRRIARGEGILLRRHAADVLAWLRFRLERPRPPLHPRLERLTDDPA